MQRGNTVKGPLRFKDAKNKFAIRGCVTQETGGRFQSYRKEQNSLKTVTLVISAQSWQKCKYFLLIQAMCLQNHFSRLGIQRSLISLSSKCISQPIPDSSKGLLSLHPATQHKQLFTAFSIDISNLILGGDPEEKKERRGEKKKSSSILRTIKKINSYQCP